MEKNQREWNQEYIEKIVQEIETIWYKETTEALQAYVRHLLENQNSSRQQP